MYSLELDTRVPLSAELTLYSRNKTFLFLKIRRQFRDPHFFQNCGNFQYNISKHQKKVSWCCIENYHNFENERTLVHIKLVEINKKHFCFLFLNFAYLLQSVQYFTCKLLLIVYSFDPPLSPHASTIWQYFFLTKRHLNF